nr:hypothetical protein [Peribacillus kribbensis]
MGDHGDGSVMLGTERILLEIAFVVQLLELCESFDPPFIGQLFEAGMTDGASSWRIYRKIVIPLSLPSMAAAAIFLFVCNGMIYFIRCCLLQTANIRPCPWLYLSFRANISRIFPCCLQESSLPPRRWSSRICSFSVS